MFESIRKHSKIVMIFLFLLIIPSFVLVGIDRNYFSEKSPVVARVDGNNINQTDWDNAHRMETDRIRAQSPRSIPSCSTLPVPAMPRWSAWCVTACWQLRRKRCTL